MLEEKSKQLVFGQGGIFSSNGDGGGYTNNNVKSNVGYQQPVSASFTHEGAHSGGSYTAHADDKIGPLPPPPGSNYVPPSSQEFRSPQVTKIELETTFYSKLNAQLLHIFLLNLKLLGMWSSHYFFIFNFAMMILKKF
uniref:Uncharacterized protein n=1 Tax=Heterorhabditis bacteriophora TaxID=37862 RepID=A0A1I7X868_HETBA